MELSIIVIGDELLIGQVTDTNSGFIAREIAPEGWRVRDVHVVAVDAEAITSAIDRAFSQSRLDFGHMILADLNIPLPLMFIKDG